ncbi:MAG: formiminotransferase-cyclodeaminase [Treponema sp.]|nr:MAG: formiminotransferase-cyclodeaminase [Treponema sp.]
MKLIDFKVKDFMLETASSSPAPGGGSISALAGSLAGALAQMVIRLTTGKKAFKVLSENVQTEFESKLSVLDELSNRLLELIDEDTDAFNSFMQALKMPKETDAEKKARSEAMQEATVLAMNIPLKTARCCEQVLEVLPLIAEHGNKNAASDAGVASLMARAGLEGAVMNVKINLSGIEDEKLCAETEKECDRLIASADLLKNKAIDFVYAKI